jgi:hypothetical protein
MCGRYKTNKSRLAQLCEAESLVQPGGSSRLLLLGVASVASAVLIHPDFLELSVDLDVLLQIDFSEVIFEVSLEWAGGWLGRVGGASKIGWNSLAGGGRESGGGHTHSSLWVVVAFSSFI